MPEMARGLLSDRSELEVLFEELAESRALDAYDVELLRIT